MSDELMLIMQDDGKFKVYDDTYDITIHCESQEEYDNVIDILSKQYLSQNDPMGMLTELISYIEELRTSPAYIVNEIAQDAIQDIIDTIQERINALKAESESQESEDKE